MNEPSSCCLSKLEMERRSSLRLALPATIEAGRRCVCMAEPILYLCYVGLTGQAFVAADGEGDRISSPNELR